jgi:hypothetical protein
MAIVTGASRGAAVESGGPAEPASPADRREPESDSERYIAAIWSEIIGLKKVTSSDRFLDIGGNSLTLTLILNRIKSERGVSMDGEPFFDPQRSSLAALAEQLDAALAAAGTRNGR